MITAIEQLPPGLIGFRASGTVTQTDFENVVVPRVDAAVKAHGELNYLLVLETSVKNFTLGAWLTDAAMGLRHLLKWNRAAIVTDEQAVKTFTAGFSALVPGEFKAFAHHNLQDAIDWAAGNERALKRST